MRKLYYFAGLLNILLLSGVAAFSQSWPITLTLSEGDRMKLYDPQPTSYSGNELVFQSAVALYQNGSSEPIFGTVWATAVTQEQGSYDRFMRMTVSGIKFPSEIDETRSAQLAASLESAIGQQQVMISRDQLKKNLELNQQKEKLSGGFNNQPPKVIYTNQPSLLVIVDGNPIWKKNDNWGMETVVNTPNTIVRANDGKIYVYGGKFWYTGNSLQQPLQYAAYPPAQLQQVADAMKTTEQAGTEEEDGFDSDFDEDENIPAAQVLVSTEPAELIQSKGEANFSPISDTELLYVENSPNDIFMDVASQQYYVLLSGRWFRSGSLKGNWQYIPAEQLPEDFARIPAGSKKDNVLASVAGTPAATNALMDAQLPQTARVDRNEATASVTYDGDPQFQSISGTRMDYAVNTSATVIRYKKRYFLVDNGVWFQSGSAMGPWAPSTVRPDEVDLIPANNPVYSVKYVYIYDVTPDYIYMGYTPGYLNTFVYGPTVVYGTGFYYRPWFRQHYFPRPFTWGFNMHYTPWYGWSMGFNYNPGWFHVGYRHRPWNNWHGGWWGPSVYRPAYCAPAYRRYGYYGYRNNTFIVNNYYGNNRRNYRYNNVYQSRPNINSRDTRRYYSSNYNNTNRNNSRPGARPSREYYGNNQERSISRGDRTINNRPDRTYRPGTSNGSSTSPQRPGQRPAISRPSSPQRVERNGNPNIRREQPAQRAEARREQPSRRVEQRPTQQQRVEQRPQRSVQQRPSQPARRQEVRRQAPSRPSGNSAPQRSSPQRNNGSSRPERRGN